MVSGLILHYFGIIQASDLHAKTYRQANIQSISYSGTGNATTDGTTIDYTPPTGVPSLTETISYVVSDGNGGTSSGTLTMRVVYSKMT